MSTSALELLAPIIEHGGRVWIEFDQIKLDVPKGIMTTETLTRLREHKPEILAAMRGSDRYHVAAMLAIASVSSREQREDLRMRYETRAAVCEYEDDLIRSEAERIALTQMVHALRQTGHPVPSEIEAVAGLGGD